MLGWSIPRGWRTDNPCLPVKKLKGGEGYAPWTWEQITYFREHAKPELWWAAALALYSGQRQGDCLSMTWGDIADGTIAVVQQKTGKKLRIAMHRDLKTVLQDVPKRNLTVLSNTRGHPWTGDGFKTSWGKELDGMEPLSGVVFHGLRKSAVVFFLEAGCTDAEVSAITGQSRSDGRALWAQGFARETLRLLRFLNGKPERIENGVCTTLVPILYNLIIYFRAKLIDFMAIPEGLEPPTPCLEGRCSILLSYGTEYAKVRHTERKCLFVLLLLSVSMYIPHHRKPLHAVYKVSLERAYEPDRPFHREPGGTTGRPENISRQIHQGFRRSHLSGRL